VGIASELNPAVPKLRRMQAQRDINLTVQRPPASNRDLHAAPACGY